MECESQAWLVLTVQPDHAGAFTVSREALDPLRTFGLTEPIAFPCWHRTANFTPKPALRSIRLTDREDDRLYSNGATLYLDGGGSIAYGWPRRRDNMTQTDHPDIDVADEDIVGALINGLWSLADWAIRSCGTSGDATVLVEMYPPANFALGLWQYRTMFPDRLHGSRALTQPSGLVEHAVSLDALRSSSRDLLMTVRHLTSDIESAFGVLGPPQISRAGELRWRYFYREKQTWLRSWAEANGVEITDDGDSG